MVATGILNWPEPQLMVQTQSSYKNNNLTVGRATSPANESKRGFCGNGQNVPPTDKHHMKSTSKPQPTHTLLHNNKLRQTRKRRVAPNT